MVHWKLVSLIGDLRIPLPSKEIIMNVFLLIVSMNCFVLCLLCFGLAFLDFMNINEDYDANK